MTDRLSWMDRMFPAACGGCGVEGRMLCRSCAAALTGPACLAWPRPSPAGLPPPWSVLAYDAVARGLLIAYKEHAAVGLRRPLAAALAAAVGAAVASRQSSGPVLIVPAPSARRAIRTRGDDVVLALARRSASRLRRDGLDVAVLAALRHQRAVADSAGLGAVERATNLAGAIGVRRAARPGLAGSTVVLVDDLITTGATLAEAARAVRECGANVLGAATIAATARRGEPRSITRPLLGTEHYGATVGRVG